LTPLLEGKTGDQIATLWFAGKQDEAVEIAILEPALVAWAVVRILSDCDDEKEAIEFCQLVLHREGVLVG